MKKLLWFAITVFPFSCTNGTLEAEMAHIKSRILLHNDSFLGYIIDSMNRRTEAKAFALYDGIAEDKAEKISDSVIKAWYKIKNIPYDPVNDAHLTYEKFMAYCEQHKIDPVKTANRLK